MGEKALSHLIVKVNSLKPNSTIKFSFITGYEACFNFGKRLGSLSRLAICLKPIKHRQEAKKVSLVDAK